MYLCYTYGFVPMHHADEDMQNGLFIHYHWEDRIADNNTSAAAYTCKCRHSTSNGSYASACQLGWYISDNFKLRVWNCAGGKQNKGISAGAATQPGMAGCTNRSKAAAPEGKGNSVAGGGNEQ